MKTYFSTVILSVVCAALLVLGGCATGEYELYAKAHASAEAARHAADSEKYKALASVAATGSDTARVAAVMALALGNNGSVQGAGAPGLRAPESNNTVLQWLSVLAPGGLTGLYRDYTAMQVGTTQSNNAALVARSTNDTFSGIARMIQAPGAVTTTTDNSVYTTPAPVVITPVIPAPVVTPVVQIVPVVAK